MQVTWKEEGGVTTFSQLLKAKKKEAGATQGDDAMGKQMARQCLEMQRLNIT